VRISSLLVTSVIATSALSIAYGQGQAKLDSQDQLALPLTELPSNTEPQAQQPTSAPTETTGPTTTSSAEPQPGETNPSTSAAPTASATATTPSAATPAVAVVIEKSSDPIAYKYGTIQLAVTKTDGRITDVTVLQGDLSYGKDVAYAALVNATIQVQGTNYGNVSGATFTTDAFKKAVENVLAKF